MKIKNLFKKIYPYVYKISCIKNNNTEYYYYATVKNYFFLLKVHKNNKILNQTNTHFNFFIKQFCLCLFTKIKFTGKGYKIKKNNKHNMMLLFNRAHITNVFFKNMFLKKLKKYKIYIQYTNGCTKIINTILNIRNINIFTKKGLRKSRQILLKKKGKK